MAITIPGIPEGIRLLEYRTSLDKPGYIWSLGAVKHFKECIGSFFTCEPAPGYDFVYDEVTDTFNPAKHLDKPISYTLQFEAHTQAAVKEIESLLTAVARHTTTFKNFNKEVS